MNFLRKSTLFATGVVGSDCKVPCLASFDANHRRRFCDANQVHVVAGTPAIINVITREIRFIIGIPFQRYGNNRRIGCFIVLDGGIVSSCPGDEKHDENSREQE